jgi:hypothetical protein
MIFETLYEASQRNELLMIDGGFCHWHLRKDGQVTIREIISTRRGAGSKMLETLKNVAGATSILARCPEDLDANRWYQKRGFILEAVEAAKSGRKINVWRLTL